MHAGMACHWAARGGRADGGGRHWRRAALARRGGWNARAPRPRTTCALPGRGAGLVEAGCGLPGLPLTIIPFGSTTRGPKYTRRRRCHAWERARSSANMLPPASWQERSVGSGLLWRCVAPGPDWLIIQRPSFLVPIDRDPGADPSKLGSQRCSASLVASRQPMARSPPPLPTATLTMIAGWSTEVVLRPLLVPNEPSR